MGFKVGNSNQKCISNNNFTDFDGLHFYNIAEQIRITPSLQILSQGKSTKNNGKSYVIVLILNLNFITRHVLILGKMKMCKCANKPSSTSSTRGL